MDQDNVCSVCGHTIRYQLEIDKGTCEILKTISSFIKKKGINAVHLSKELLGPKELNGLTHHQIGNISRPRFHGLVAKVKGEAGNYSITTKGL